MNRSAKNTQCAVTTENDPQRRLLVAHDSQADGKVYYAIKTTGVYRRPFRAARLARTENVQFHATCEEAERAGFLPCKRCNPNESSLVEQHEKGNTNAWH